MINLILICSSNLFKDKGKSLKFKKFLLVILLFSDNLWDGKEIALDEAIYWRDQKEKELGKPRTDRVVVMRNPRNKTGTIGVCRKLKKYYKRGKCYTEDVYEVTCTPVVGEGSKKTSVSVRKWGEKEALKRAITIRKQMEQNIYT